MPSPYDVRPPLLAPTAARRDPAAQPSSSSGAWHRRPILRPCPSPCSLKAGTVRRCASSAQENPFTHSSDSFGSSWQAPRVEEGLYESLISREVQAKVDALEGLDHEESEIDDAEEPHVLARHVAAVITARLSAVRSSDERLTLVNNVLRALDPDTAVAPPSRQLLGISDSNSIVGSPGATRPSTPLSDAALLTNAHGEPSSAPNSAPRSTPLTRSTCSAPSSSGTACGCSRPSCGACARAPASRCA